MSQAESELATAWLDGCSGCHMSLLDVDEGIVARAQASVDIVYGPLVDAQEFPENVDVAVVEGAVSSQDDEKLAAPSVRVAHPRLAGRLRRDRQRAVDAQHTSP